MKRNIVWTKAPFFGFQLWSVMVAAIKKTPWTRGVFCTPSWNFELPGSEPCHSMSQVEKWEGLLCRASDFNRSHEKVRAWVKVDMGWKGSLEFVWWGFTEASRSYILFVFFVKPFTPTLEVLSVLMMMMMMRRRRICWRQGWGWQWRSFKITTDLHRSIRSLKDNFQV